MVAMAELVAMAEEWPWLNGSSRQDESSSLG